MSNIGNAEFRGLSQKQRTGLDNVSKAIRSKCSRVRVENLRG